MTLFIVLYPGFMEYSVVITYGHFLLIFTFFFLSIALMLIGERYPRYYWPALIGGVLCSAVNLFTLEYYFGIELLRPLLLWVVVSEIIPERRNQIKRTLMAYVPYGIVLICFILWRIFGFHSQDYGIVLGANSGFLQSLATMLLQVPGAIWTSSVGAWLEIFRFPSTIDFGIVLSVIYFIILLGSFAGLIFYVSRLKSLENQSNSPVSDKKSSGNGLLSVLALCSQQAFHSILLALKFA